MKKISYKKSGVDIKKADRLTQWIKKTTLPTQTPLGSDYAGLWPFKISKYKNPVLVATTDGVGSKVMLAKFFNKWEGIGQDLVAMCVNDLICLGAKPLFFLDYYACGELKSLQAKQFLKGLKKACQKASCPLLGGETAELPGLYAKGDMDCAGFCVGVVEKSKILGPQRVKAGDQIVAFKSSGFHSNGYSLLRKIYKNPAELKKNKNQLMQATKLYTFLTPYLLKLKGLRAMAHITGGGLNNISRILPKTLMANLNPWVIPKPFLEVKKKANLSLKEILTTFNCGLGLVLIVKNKKELLNYFPKKDLISLGTVSLKTKKKSWDLNFKALAQFNGF